jgi:hypothetical protein
MNKATPNASQLLDAVAAKLGLKSDAALSRVLEIAPPVISKLRHGALPVRASVLLRMHEESGISIRELKSYLVPENVNS